MKEATQKDKNKEDDDIEVCRTGEVEVVSSGSRYLSLLTSKDRDFLLSPTGTQVLSLSLSLSLSLITCFVLVEVWLILLKSSLDYTHICSKLDHHHLK